MDRISLGLKETPTPYETPETPRLGGKGLDFGLTVKGKDNKRQRGGSASFIVVVVASTN